MNEEEILNNSTKKGEMEGIHASDDDDDSNKVDGEGGFDELNIQGALTDELKVLQDRNRVLQQQLEEMERRVVHLMHAKGILEAQVAEITQVSRHNTKSGNFCC